MNRKLTSICLLVIRPKLPCLVLIGGKNLLASVHHLTMLAAPFFDDDAEVDGYASDDEPEDESSGGPPSNRAILVRRGVRREVGEYDRGFHASSDGQLSST